MLPSTTNRVSDQTDDAVNHRIEAEYQARIAHYADHPDQIPARLQELVHEWDIERAIEANAATLALTGVALGVTLDRRWLVLPALVTRFLLQHALQGWCPPVPILRRMGFRTATEIERERHALKALRGDISGVAQAPDRVAAALRAVAA